MRRFVGISLAVALVFTGAQLSAESSRLQKLTQRGALLGWEAVGRVAISGQGYCTGVLIAPDLVLTAAHCVYDKRTGARHGEDKLTFQAGWRDGKSIAERGVGKVAAHPDYVPTAGTSIENLRTDAALLKLTTAIPAATAAPFVLHGPAKTGQSVSVVSYGRGRDTALSWQRKCGLLGRQNGIIAFDCDVTFGSSGAPVFVRTGQRARILSLVSQGVVKGDNKVSFGMELPEVVAELKRELRRTPSAPFVNRKVTNKSGGARFVKARKRSP